MDIVIIPRSFRYQVQIIRVEWIESYRCCFETRQLLVVTFWAEVEESKELTKAYRRNVAFTCQIYINALNCREQVLLASIFLYCHCRPCDTTPCKNGSQIICILPWRPCGLSEFQ